MKGFFKILLIVFFLGSLICACGKRESPQKQIRGKENLKERPRQAGKKGDSAPKDFILSLDKYGRQDPFNPVLDKKVRLAGKGLNGIIWDEKDPKAVIDGKIVGIGEKAGAGTVIEIEQDRVILSDGAREYELKLGR